MFLFFIRSTKTTLDVEDEWVLLVNEFRGVPVRLCASGERRNRSHRGRDSNVVESDEWSVSEVSIRPVRVGTGPQSLKSIHSSIMTDPLKLVPERLGVELIDILPNCC